MAQESLFLLGNVTQNTTPPSGIKGAVVESDLAYQKAADFVEKIPAFVVGKVVSLGEDETKELN